MKPARPRPRWGIARPLAAAKAWVLEAKDADIVKPWDQKGWKMPGGAPYHPAGFMTFVGASAMVNGRTQGVYPAAKALLSAVYEGALVPFDTALKIEARWFTNVLMNPSSSAMIRSLFINKEALEKGANRPDVPDQTVRKLGVLGAGMMGAGIAYVAANAGIEVVLLDQKQEAAEKGRAHSEGLLDKGIARKKVTPEKKDEVLEFLEEHQAANTNYLFDNPDVYALIEAVDPSWAGALPYTLLVAPGGEIIYSQMGEIDPMALKKEIVDYVGRYYF